MLENVGTHHSDTGINCDLSLPKRADTATDSAVTTGEKRVLFPLADSLGLQDGLQKTRRSPPPRPQCIPPSTKEERVRANGLINKRIKLGRIIRPDFCQKCGARCRADAHHTDY